MFGFTLPVSHSGCAAANECAPERESSEPKAALERRLFCHLRKCSGDYWVTVNFVELTAVPSGVVTSIAPVFAPDGTLVSISMSDLTVKAAFTPPNVTLVAPVKLVPFIVTGVPTEPLVGLKLRIAGRTRNAPLLVSSPAGVVTVTTPAVVPDGTIAVR